MTTQPPPITRAEFYSRVSSASLDIVRRAIAENAFRIKPWLGKSQQEPESPFELGITLRREEQYIQRLYTMTTEVVDSFAAMRHVETYLARFAFSRRGIPASAYIRYHLESFLNEAYILQERMLAFAAKFAREWRSAFTPEEVKRRVTYVRGETARMFEPLVRMRGRHVHGTRYADAELGQLLMWELVAEQDPVHFAVHLRRCAASVRRRNLEFIKGVNDGLERHLETFFDYFAGVAFTSDGELQYPPNIRGS